MSASRKIGPRFVVTLGLLLAGWIVAGLLKAGVEVPGGEIFVLGAMAFGLWGLVRSWSARDPEQRQAVKEYRSRAASRVEHKRDL